VIPARLAFIGLETTGANPLRDRITKIGVLEAEGDRVSTWSTLVNPQRPIPEFIQQLNGSRDATVADAPTFAQVAAELADRLHGRLFIAHHARFNYAFVKRNSNVSGSPSGPTCCVLFVCLASSSRNTRSTTWRVSWSVMI